MSYREEGKTALSHVLSIEKNIQIIEKYIYIASQTEGDEEISTLYKRMIYQVVGDILNGEKLKTIVDNIKLEKTGWDHPSFNEISNYIAEQDDFIEFPFEAVEGVQQCKKFNEKTGKPCNSKRVIYYQKQQRGSDEPMTTHNTCCVCGNKWSYSG